MIDDVAFNAHCILRFSQIAEGLAVLVKEATTASYSIGLRFKSFELICFLLKDLLISITRCIDHPEKIDAHVDICLNENLDRLLAFHELNRPNYILHILG